MEELTSTKICKYCHTSLEICLDEGLQCDNCRAYVHVRCLKRGSVPGGLNGDIFFKYTCIECSNTGAEEFVRLKLSWLQIICLSLYHLSTMSPGLARNGFFHWRSHIVSFISRNWNNLFTYDVKKRKKWVGTVAGRLSYYRSYIFLSGARHGFNKPAWWTLVYPKLTPYAITLLYAAMVTEKQQAKAKGDKKVLSDAELFQIVLKNYIKNTELIQPYSNTAFDETNPTELAMDMKDIVEEETTGKRKSIFPDYTQMNEKKIMSGAKFLDNVSVSSSTSELKPVECEPKAEVTKVVEKPKIKLLDPMCHYNTSLNSIARMKSQRLQVKLMGGIRKEMVYSPYSKVYLKPYIYRNTEAFPTWLRLMMEIKLVANKNNPDFKLEPRGPIDFTYVQPEQIPAINSLCNQFFWPGIDLTETLQYPDFSCVALYKNLIVGFAFAVPGVSSTENYVSFIFVRPGWRNCGIAKFMMYHLIQVGVGKDLTLHVSVNNPAFFLYQKFGFKVENVIKDFYETFYRGDVSDSKHAFFCRLER